MRQIYGIDEKGVTINVTGKTCGDSGFSLQDWIDSLYGKKSRNKSWQEGNVPAHAVLFGVENENYKISKWLLSEWKIAYVRQEEWMASMRKEDVKGTS
jgi:hypothetical protein